MRCHRCFDLELQNDRLRSEVDELRLQALEMAQTAHDLKLEVRHYLAMLGVPLPDASTSQSVSPESG